MGAIRIIIFAVLACIFAARPACAQNPSPASCQQEIPSARLGAPSALIVQLDPDTYWRPENSLVKFTIAGTGGTTPVITQVYACFRWEPRAGETSPAAGFYASPLVRSMPSADGLIEYGAIVPAALGTLTSHGNGPNLGKNVQHTAAGTVPLADMQILIEQPNGQWTAVILPVGITNVQRAVIMLAVFIAFAVIILWRWAPQPLLGGVRGFGFKSISRHALAIISSPDGIASLSQFQIMLWTFVVAGSAIYVMVLSGNLIAISDGTLTLLGIAGGTSIVSRVQKNNEDDTRRKAGAPDQTFTPAWSQMLLNNVRDKEIDVTRVQMLAFTLITAAFVSIQVAATYSIPEIPENFLVLMGISNGVYLAGRQTQPRTAGAPALTGGD
jgi:hypothetical protein